MTKMGASKCAFLTVALIVLGWAFVAAGDAAPTETEKHIARLGDASYEVREAATKALIEMGSDVIPLVRGALESPDPEVRWRAERILAEITAASRPEKRKSADEAPGPRGLEGDAGEILKKLLEGFGRLDERGLRLRFGPDGFKIDPLDLDIDRDAFGFPPEDIEKLMEDMEKRFQKRLEFWKDLPGGHMERRSRLWRFKDGKWVLERDEHEGPGAQAGEARSGLRLGPVPETLRFHLSVPGLSGLMVEVVEPGSPAEAFGFRPFDILLEVGGKPVEGPEDVDRALRTAGTKQFRIVRKGEPKDLTGDWHPETPDDGLTPDEREF